MAIPAELKSALNEMRAVRARRPQGPSTTRQYAEWRINMAVALESLSAVLSHPADRQMATEEAAAARAEASSIIQAIESPHADQEQ
ncbi:hypothetical protein SAMN04488564_103361 [Lentzea waywayandensis]|uniref:Uncharacterized protein n=1 Tax=Lentzea waywayandensis TaxID=84724 RepID=A0A1I6DXQ3_9PSEU|nr:hypothetical protein [Lentzea waywayandensis]SFR10289.1 hypothetical protein SAMN04488564_103361 [Lentzea waywayandensis]